MLRHHQQTETNRRFITAIIQCPCSWYVQAQAVPLRHAHIRFHVGVIQHTGDTSEDRQCPELRLPRTFNKALQWRGYSEVPLVKVSFQNNLRASRTQHRVILTGSQG